MPPSRLISMTEPPCAIISTSTMSLVTPAKALVLAAASADAAEHELAVRVLVIDDQEAVVGAAIERHEAEEVVVVAELLGLARQA